MDKADLFRPRLPEDTVETAAGVMRVRGLSRAEVMELRRYAVDAYELDCQMLHKGLVDPVLTLEEAREWCKAWPITEIDPVSHKIAQLSGMEEDEDAEAVREESFPGGAGESV